MTVNYLAIPYSNDEQLVQWLAECSIVADETTQIGNYPTLEEMRKIIESLPECSIVEKVGLAAYAVNITCEDHQITVLVDADEYDRAHHLSFSGSPRIIEAIVRRLAMIKGSFIILGNGEADMLINPPLSE